MNSKEYKTLGAVLLLVLATCLIINRYFCEGNLHDLSLNIIAETFGIVITIFFINTLMKNVEWRRRFFMDKQIRFKYIHEIIDLNDLIIDCLKPETKYINEENKSLLIDLTKLQITTKLSKAPMTETFGDKPIAGNEHNCKIIDDSVIILNELEIYIKCDNININKLISINGKLLRAGFNILSMKS